MTTDFEKHIQEFKTKFSATTMTNMVMVRAQELEIPEDQLPMFLKGVALGANICLTMLKEVAKHGD